MTTDEQDDALIDRLAKAGGIAGPSNRTWWLDLVESYGEALVVELLTAKRAETRQPVSVAVIAKLASDEWTRRQQAIDDAAEDAATGEQIARTSKESQGAASREREPSAGKGAAAAAVVEPSPVAAATGDHPPTTEQKRQAAAEPYCLTEEDKIMATCKQLLKRVEDEISRRGMLIKDAMSEIGVAATAIYAWRKDGKLSDATQAKIKCWLPESERLAAGSDLSREKAPKAKPAKASTPAEDETVALVRKDVAVSPGAATFGPILSGAQHPVHASFEQRNHLPLMLGDSIASAQELLTQGANLADALRTLGATGYADVVTTLVERLRTVRAALSV